MLNSETIYILCATDDNYAPYCGIMLTSLFVNNKDCQFVVYVFVDGSLTEENVERYKRLGTKYGNDIKLKFVDESLVKRFPLNKRVAITLPTYYRLLAADLLPDMIHRVIYLDCDALVVGDIKPLWNVNIDGIALAGVMDCALYFDSLCNRLGYSVEYSYFNAGVLVLNLDYWRENCLTKKVVKFIFDNYSHLRWMDQDALNGTLYNVKLLLPARYNYSTRFFLKKFWENYSLERQKYYLEESGNIVIIHYQGNKPWNYKGYGGPFFPVWEKYRRESLWRDCRNIKPLGKHIKHLVKRYLFTGLFRSQHQEWAVTPENKKLFKNYIL